MKYSSFNNKNHYSLKRQIIFSLLLLCTACSGIIGDAANSPTATNAALQCTDAKLSPGPSLIRRLSRFEIARTLEDILGVESSQSISLLPADSAIEYFSNNVNALSMSPDLAQRLQALAKQQAESIMAVEPSSRAVFACDTNSMDDCLRNETQRLARLFFRREASSKEVDDLLTLATNMSGGAGDEAATIILEILPQMPQFLFRVERGEANEERPLLNRLSGEELASRLSFLLWGAGPDQILLNAALSGELNSADGISAQATRMLDDPKADRAYAQFRDELFDIEALEHKSLDTDAREELRTSTLNSAVQQLRTMIDTHVWQDDFRRLFDTQNVPMNDDLAQIYGSSVTSTELADTALAENTTRAGLFGTPGFLMVTTQGLNTSSVHRGKYVVDRFLCQDIPAPPDDIDPSSGVESDNPADFINARLSTQPCAGCHERMEGPGIALERFDMIGAERDEYSVQTESGTQSYSLAQGFYQNEAGDRVELSNATELGNWVANSQELTACIADRFLQFAMGRVLLEESDGCTRDFLTRRFAESGYNYRTAIIEFVRSDAFRYRVAQEGEAL